MYFIEFLGQMMSLSHLIYPSKGLDHNNDQSFEPGQPKPDSMENLKNNFPAISTFKNYIPSLDMIKSMFTEKYNEATWVNVHTFILNSGKTFNTPEFFMALQFAICVYFPGMALGIVYQYYELDQQTQLIQKQQDQEEDIYQVILQEIQQQQPQQSRAYIKQQLQSQEMQQQSLQAMTTRCLQSQSTPMMQFVQFIQRLIEQVIQTPQSMLYQIQYEQDCQSIYNQVQQMQQNNHQYSSQEMQCEEMQIHKQGMSGCGMEQGMNQLRYQEQFIIVTIKQQVYPSATTTNSTQNNNENGGVNMIMMVIKIKLPGEGRQIVQF